MSTVEAILRRHPVPMHLRPYIAGIVGFDETAPDEGRFRVQPAGSVALLEISFTGPLSVYRLDGSSGAADTSQAFIAGMTPWPVRTVFFHRHACVQIYFAPSGAQRLFGVSGADIASRVTPLTDLTGRHGIADDLSGALAEAPRWRERFQIVENFLSSLAEHADREMQLADWMWGEIRRTGGQARVAAVAERSGWSPRYMNARFVEAFGIPPKVASGIIRFERIHAELNRLRLAELAVRHGLSDQSHLTREVRRHSGESPQALADAHRPTAFTALGHPAIPGRHRQR